LIIYVETNFVLELAYQRSTFEHCQRLLDLAAQRRIELVIPSFALVEARMAWQRNVTRRTRLHSQVRTELGELARSRPLMNIPAQSQAFVAALIDSAQQDRDRLEAAVSTLADIGSVIATTPATLRLALSVEQRVGLSPQDALVYASVVEHIGSGGPIDRVFVTQNKNDFASVKDELEVVGCKLLFAFDAADGYVRSKVAAS
jgi:predicted nucleic acid-binding protein